jgi:metal-responsive CopG/Arc/MetJ family transcriptional regulator
VFSGDRIKLDKELLEKVKKYSQIAGYASPDEFVRHVIEREIAKFEKDGDTQEEIRRRMQGLGYIS